MKRLSAALCSVKTTAGCARQFFLAQVDAEALIRDHGAEAYSEARQRERDVTLPDGTTHAGGTSSPETGSKEIRAEPFASQVNIGNVALCAAAWNRAYIDELRHFPNVAYDDQVDASSRAFMRLMEIAGPMDIPDEVMIWARRKAR